MKDWESVRERKQIWRGQGRAWSSNQQLTGVRMFMGRVSFKRPVLCQFSCGLKRSSSLILKLRREKKIHFQPGSLLHWTKSIFSPKSNNSFWFGNWIVESFSAFFFFYCPWRSHQFSSLKSTGPWKHIFPRALGYTCTRIGRNTWRYTSASIWF